MDSQTTSPAAPAPDPGPLAAMLHKATIDKVKGNEFNNTAGDMFKIVLNNYNATKPSESQMFESSDAINFFQNVVLPFLAEVRKNDQSKSTAAETAGMDGSDPVSQAITADHTVEGDPVDLMDIVPLEPSSFPVASVADRYARSMLTCLAGYALYNPKPLSELSKEYLRHGVNVGDVGFVRWDGTFDFLFNICPSNNGLINPSKLPDGFSLKTPDHSATRDLDPLPHDTCLFHSPITRTGSGEYICEGSEGAILELPEGAVQDEAMNVLPFEKLAARYGVQWYDYTMTRGRKISNGSLYLITSFTKCNQWGIAVFDRPCAPGQGLRFSKKRSLPFGNSTSKYHWNGSRVFSTKVSNPDQGDTPNQCVFLRGYKIMVREDIFNNLCNDQRRGSDPEIPSSSPQEGSTTMTRHRATRIRGGGGPDPMSKVSEQLPSGGPSMMSTMAKSDEVVLRANFNSSLAHPSDLINAALLSQNPGAKVALTHDEVWCDLLRDNFPNFNYATLVNIARSYTTTVDEYDCVSLERIPALNNMLHEGSHPLVPLQGTEAPALQRFLTTPEDDYAPVPAVPLSLPRALVKRILLFLDTESMLTCRLVNREFNETVQFLQYFLACKTAGVIDNPRSPLSCTERLEALEKREDAWRKLEPVFETTIKVNHKPFGNHGLTAGIYFLDDNNLKDLHYCRLPSSPQDNPQWVRIPGHGPTQNWSGLLVSFALAVYEHDLVINVVSSEIGTQTDVQRHSLDLVLLKFSTGEYHPLARHPRIHVQGSPDAQPGVIPTVLGDSLVLVVGSEDNTSLHQLFIFDWKTGHKRLQHETAKDGYSTPVFVSPELLLVPNLALSSFEIWHLPPSDPNATPPVQILSLQLPAVSHPFSIFGLTCDGGSSPFIHSIPDILPRPFFPSPENSVIIANLRVETYRRPRSAKYYTLIISRRALLDTIQKLVPPSLLEQLDLPERLTNEVTMHKISDLDSDGLVRLGAQSQLVSTKAHRYSSPRTIDSRTFATSQTSPASPISHISADAGPSSISSESFTTSSTYQYNFPQVQWADWGPPISRWFRVAERRGILTSTSAGQRCALLFPHPHGRSIVSVVDFNPHNFRRNAEGEDNGGNGSMEEGKFDHEGRFSEEVYMGLKCVVYNAPDEYDFDAVLMDEERLLGVKYDQHGNPQSVKVLYFG